MKPSSYTFVILSLVCLNFGRITRADDDPHPCLEKLSVEDKEKAKTIAETCMKKVGLDAIPNMAEVEKNNFEDKCYAKCKLFEMKMINDKGQIDKATVDEFLKKVSPDKQADITTLLQTCVESTMKAMEAEGGANEKNMCKAAAMLKTCFMKGITKFC